MLLEPIIKPVEFDDTDLCYVEIVNLALQLQFGGRALSKNDLCVSVERGDGVCRIRSLGVFVTHNMVHWVAYGLD